MMCRASVIATVVVILGGFSALYLGTNGGTIWSAETARRAELLERRQPLPAHKLIDTQGQTLSLIDSTQSLLVVDFIYTNCPTVCSTMGMQFRRLQSELQNADLLDKVQLLSITFDPSHDDQTALANYLKRFNALEPYWRAARFEQPAALKHSLSAMGVIVIPEPTIGFVHNAAIYLIHNGEIAEIFDVDEQTALFEAIRLRAAS